MSHISLGVRAIALLVVVGSTLAEARPLDVHESYPTAEIIVVGRNALYVVRFDGWIDHSASRLDVTANGKIAASLVPTEDSEPNILAASSPRLAPGRYQLRWNVKCVFDGDFSNGAISFKVGMDKDPKFDTPNTRYLGDASRPSALATSGSGCARPGQSGPRGD